MCLCVRACVYAYVRVCMRTRAAVCQINHIRVAVRRGKLDITQLGLPQAAWPACAIHSWVDLKQHDPPVLYTAGMTSNNITRLCYTQNDEKTPVIIQIHSV